MSTECATHVGPFAVWRIPKLPRRKPPLLSEDLRAFLASPPFALLYHGTELTVQKVAHDRIVYFPEPPLGEGFPPLPRPMICRDLRLVDDSEAIIDAVGTHIPLGERFGVEATLELAGVDPQAELVWFRQTYAEHLKRLRTHYGKSGRVSWGLVGYWY